MISYQNMRSLVHTFLFLLAFHSILSNGNFKTNPLCYHQISDSCRAENEDGDYRCGYTTSMLNSKVQCTISRNTRILDVKQRNDSVSLVFDVTTSYPSSNYLCYPYLNIKWRVPEDIAKQTTYFKMELTYDFLGRKMTLERIMSLKFLESTTFNTSVQFKYKCHQVDYPGAKYKINVIAVDKNLQVIASGSNVYISYCNFKLSENQYITMITGVPVVDEEWKPKHRIVIHDRKVEIFYTMPDCKPWKKFFRISLTHATTNKSTYLGPVPCQCHYSGSLQSDDMADGVYTVEFQASLVENSDGYKHVISFENIKVPENLTINTEISCLKEWKPKHRIVIHGRKVEIFYTMPDCKLGKKFFRIRLTHSITKKSTYLGPVPSQFYYNGSLQSDDMEYGVYSVELQTSIQEEAVEYVHTISFEDINISDNFTFATEMLESTSTDNIREQMDYRSLLFVIGGISISSIAFLFCTYCYCTKPPTYQKLKICIKGKWNFKKTLKKTEAVSSVQKSYQTRKTCQETSTDSVDSNLDSGINSKCSQSVPQSPEYVQMLPITANICKQNLSTGHDSCNFSIDLGFDFYPPSDDDGVSINSETFKTEILQLNNKMMHSHNFIVALKSSNNRNCFDCKLPL